MPRSVFLVLYSATSASVPRLSVWPVHLCRSLSLRKHSEFRYVSFYRCAKGKRTVFAARGTSVRCADGGGNVQPMVVVLVKVLVVVTAAAAATAARATLSLASAAITDLSE